MVGGVTGVTDELLSLMNVPSLADAKAREAVMGKYVR